MKKSRQFFLNEVTNQIASKEAKKYVSDELNYHVQKAKNVWIKKGLVESEAEEKAIEQMGSPITLGIQLNKLHRPRVDWLMVALLIMTFIMGLLPMSSQSNMDSVVSYTSRIIIVLLGCAVAFCMMMFDYRKLREQGWLFYIIGITSLLLLRIFFNTTTNGQPMMKMGPVTIEGSMVLPFFLIAWSSLFNNSKVKFWHFVALFSISFFPLLMVNNFSTIYIYSIMVFVMLWWSNLDRKRIFVISAFAVSSISVFSIVSWSYLKSYQQTRFLAFFHPEAYPNDSAYIILHLKDILAKAGWFGNPSNQEFIPDSFTNFVFVSFTSYYGWLLALVLVLVLSLFVVRIIVVIRKITDSFGKLLLIGAVALFAVQLVSNITMAFGFFPSTTMSLPFISYGLMPTIFNALLIGVALSVYRRKDLISRVMI